MDGFIDSNAEGLVTIREFAGRPFVMRLDEAAIDRATLVEDLVFMRSIGVRPIVVLDVEQRSSSERLVGLINRVGGEAVSLDGTSASTFVVAKDAEGRPTVRSVNGALVSLLLERGYIPIFSAQGASLSGTAEPLDPIDAARELAAALRAKRLLFPSERGGILANQGIVEELTSSEALALAAAGTLAPDDAKKLEAAALGVRSGVDAAQLLDLGVSHAALVELLTAQHLGTQVVSNVISVSIS